MSIVAIVGAESTGKTLLSQTLAAALSARGHAVRVVQEWLRSFCAEQGRTPRRDEQADIATTQWRHIEAAAADGALVLADTTPLMTAVYSEIVFGDRSLYAEALARQARCTLTLLTGLDLPWQPDGLQRDGPHVQVPVDTLLRNALDGARLPYAVIYGQGTQRHDAALAALTPWLAPAASSSAASTSVPDTANAPAPRLRSRCRECLQPDCEHQLLLPRP